VAQFHPWIPWDSYILVLIPLPPPSSTLLKRNLLFITRTQSPMPSPDLRCHWEGGPCATPAGPSTGGI
jgi:hypothetical protein